MASRAELRKQKNNTLINAAIEWCLLITLADQIWDLISKNSLSEQSF